MAAPATARPAAAFAFDLIGDLPGPDWLIARRAEAAAELMTRELPTADDEDWRYTPIGEIDTARFQPAIVPGSVGSEPFALENYAALIEVVDGHVVSVIAEDVLETLQVFTAADLADAALVHPAGPDVFAVANTAFGPGPIVVRVPRGQRPAGPVVVVNHHVTDDVLSAPSLVVDVAEDAALDVVEIHTGEADALVVPVTDLRVASAGRLRHTVIQQLGDRARQIGTLRSQVAQQGSLLTVVVALGAGYARTRNECLLVGRGAEAALLAIGYGDEDQTLDFRTFQEHLAPDTTSELLYKGVVDDRARSIATGLIHVGTEGRGTNAFQTNRAIKLGEESWAETVPNLQIENNDVHCSHASTVGPIDPDQAFYLHSRGVPPGVAERLIVMGFLDEVLSRLPQPELAAQLRVGLTTRLEAGGYA